MPCPAAFAVGHCCMPDPGGNGEWHKDKQALTTPIAPCAALPADEEVDGIAHMPEWVMSSLNEPGYQAQQSMQLEESETSSTAAAPAQDPKKEIPRSVSGVSGRRSAKRRLSGNSDDMAKEVSRVVSFRGSKELLRASRISTVMGRLGALFVNREGAAATFALSEEVSNIDEFLSHNWSVHQIKKFLCLALRFNHYVASIASCVACLIMAVVASQGGVLFAMKTPVSSTDPSLGLTEHGCGCTLVMTPVLLLVACFGQDFKRLVGFPGCKVFLDKTCIHQTDMSLKRQGILKLGAFLRSSSRMTVLYTDIYLTKLWTVYEVACFLSLHAPSDLIVIPTFTPILVYVGTLFWWVSTLLLMFVGSYSGLLIPSLLICYGTACALGIMIVRSWLREKEALRRRIANFDCNECTCYCQDDRPLVQQNIALLMRATGEVDSNATIQESLKAFNGVVRRRLETSLTASIGPYGLTYFQVVMIYVCNVLPRDMDIRLLGLMPQEGEWVLRYRIAFMLYTVIYVFGLYPLFLVLIFKYCSFCLHLRSKIMNIAFVAGGVCWVQTLGLVWSMMIRRLAWTAIYDGPKRDAALVILVLLFVLTTLLALCIYKRARHVGKDEDDNETAEEGEEAEKTLQPDLDKGGDGNAEDEQEDQM